LARQYGIYGFCYYHYWFNGKRILERPFQEVIQSGKPDFPFMLCWANENWTSSWDGGKNHILLEQKYSPEDALAHIRTLIPFFKDHRYIRIHNKPVIAIYRSTIIPDIENMLKIWREEAAKHRMELYICRFETFGRSGQEYLNQGFDAAIEFPPFTSYDIIQRKYNRMPVRNRIQKLKQFYLSLFNGIKHNDLILKYQDVIDADKEHLASVDYKVFPCCMPGWDNTARRKTTSLIIPDNTPEKFGKWFKQQIDYATQKFESEEQFIFINAWNEWAEGNHLEPCRKWGTAFLEQIQSVLNNQR
jgi:lipopolysaccharide biosynthesis protein